MISRYTPSRMGQVWTSEARFRNMLEVELLACEALSKLGQVPAAAARRIRAKARLSVEGVNRRESKTKHDVVAFLGELASHIGKDAQYLHLGLTSSDVLDTATAVQLAQSCDILLEDLAKLQAVVKGQARKHRDTLCIGRTHGVHAEPTTWGLKLAVFYAELGRATGLLRLAREQAAVGKVSGAVGTYAHLDPRVEQYICAKLKIRPALISTQVVPRDGYAALLCRMAIVGGMLERFSTEIRHLQRTEVLEAEEPFEEGQTGSSAMPHKRNPVSCERVTGMSRLLRGYAGTSLENMALWHERDIAHSSTERVILPDSACILDFMILDMTRILKGLRVYPAQMRKNLELTRGLIFSESVLLALMKTGLARPAAYKIVQRNALAAWAGKGDFLSLLRKDAEVRKRLGEKQLAACFDLRRHLKHAGAIFRRLGL